MTLDRLRPARFGDVVYGIASGLIGVLAAVWITRGGMMTFNDSAAYLAAATNISDGRGIWANSPDTGSHLSVAAQLALHGSFPLSAWPPGYPLLLGLVMQFGATALGAAMVLSIVGGGAVGAATYIGGRSTIRLPRSVAFIVALGTVIGPNVNLLAFGPLMGHGFAYAESIFIPLVVITIVMGIHALRRPTALRVIVTSGLIVAITLVRDTGPIYGIALAAGAYTLRSRPTSRRVQPRLLAGGIFAVIGFAGAFAWSMANRKIFGSSPPIRHLGWYGGPEPLGNAIKVLAGWFGVPWGAPALVHLIVVVVGIVLPLVAVFGVKGRHRLWRPGSDLQMAMVVLASAVVLSLAAVLFTGFFLDRTTAPDARHLAPAQPFAYLLAAASLYQILSKSPTILGRRLPPRFAAPAVVIVGTLCLIHPLWILPAQRADLHHTPLQVQALGVFADMPDDVRIVTNAPDELWLLTGRTSLVLPPDRYFTTGSRNPDFSTGLDGIAQLAHHEPVIVATSRSIPFSSEAATDYLVDRRDFELVTSCGPMVELWAMKGTNAAQLARSACPEG